MAKPWNRMETWLALGVVGLGALLTLILGLPIFMSATAEILHPDPTHVPSVMGSEPDSADTWAPAIERGREAVRAALAEQNLPGLSVAAGAGGTIIWAEGFGWADLEDRVPVEPETRFRIGTASVPLTSAAVGLLLEQGRLRLDDEIRTYVPEFPKKEWPVTLRQLMGHVAGVRTDSGDEGPLFSQHCERPVEALEYFADRSLLFEPGTAFRYSSYGWILVSAAIEAAAGEPFLRFMRKQVFEPVGMLDTVPDSTLESISDRATSYFPRFGGDPRYGLHLMRPLDYSCYAGASVFLSTPSDLVRFGMAIDGGKLLQPETVDLLYTPQRLSSGGQTGYGLGWQVDRVELAGKHTDVVGHDGDLLGGMTASLVILREHGIVVSVIANISYADTADAARRIAEAFAEQASTSLH